MTIAIDTLRKLFDALDGSGEFVAGPSADEIRERFDRDDAVAFYHCFDPEDVELDSVLGQLRFGAFKELPELQDGYGIVQDSPSPEWPAGRWVIATVDANPITLPHGAGEVCFDLVGSGRWEPRPIAADLAGLFDILIAWGETVRTRGDELYDDTWDVHPDSMEDFTSRIRARGIDEQHLANLLSLR